MDGNVRKVESFFVFKHKLKKAFELPKNKLYSLSASLGAINHARMRMGLSALNNQRFEYDLIDYSTCNCGAPKEDISHFFIDCPRYAAHRTTLLDQLKDIIELASENTPNLDLREDTLKTFFISLILYGKDALGMKNNIRLFQIVHKYIIDSNRFIVIN